MIGFVGLLFDNKNNSLQGYSYCKKYNRIFNWNPRTQVWTEPKFTKGHWMYELHTWVKKKKSISNYNKAKADMY